MSTSPPAEIHSPLIRIEKPGTPLLFLDTLFWAQLLKDPAASDARLLGAACKRGSFKLILTDLVKGELKQRGLLSAATDLCGSALVAIPMDRIALNQALRSLVGYLGHEPHVDLRWDLMISAPANDTPAERLRSWLADFAAALNSDRRESPGGTKETWTSGMAAIESTFWRERLEIYKTLLSQRQSGQSRTFERFFSTDYFLDLPVVALKVYYLGDILGQRCVRPQDIVDVYSLGELLPYSRLYLMDKEQHARLHNLVRRYPPLFGNLENITAVRSHWTHSEDPWTALRALLTSL